MLEWPSAVRGSALWGSRGGDKRRVAPVAAMVLVLAFALQLMLAGTADAARMPKSLRDAIKASPTASFKVIVTGTKKSSSTTVEGKINKAMSTYRSTRARTKKKYTLINAVAGEYTGQQLAMLDADASIESISPDGVVRSAGYSNANVWPNVHQAVSYWGLPNFAAPAIAVVDSGVDATRAGDFGARVLKQVNFTTLTPNSAGDGRGHGTFVAGIAAGQADGYTGYAPTSNIVSLDVLADDGQGLTSDVIAAAEWIHANKATYGIRVANFSLTGSSDSSFMYDPLCKAVEKLWLNGVVVVASVGNYAVNGAESGVRYAPANDPFIITVGADDTDGSTGIRDDFNAPWSAYGYTFDGFLKPEVSASGRYQNGPAPTSSTMYTERPDRVVAPGYMWMSGTSFAAPIVSGAAASILARHPGLTPDQVKGMLMLTATPVDSAAPNSVGVGEIRGYAASGGPSGDINPPNPNLDLNRFLVTDPNNSALKMFDAASWSSAAKADASWNSASWSSASWSSASWSSASWSSASWSSASWSSASWSSGQLSDGALPQASWASSIWVQ
ncbi:MAG: S8 family serine peptidase [Actinomycetota bacterium]|nr:S8 family serine peptidase [Actinomycetota bacterium]